MKRSFILAFLLGGCGVGVGGTGAVHKGVDRDPGDEIVVTVEFCLSNPGEVKPDECLPILNSVSPPRTSGPDVYKVCCLHGEFASIRDAAECEAGQGTEVDPEICGVEQVDPGQP